MTALMGLAQRLRLARTIAATVTLGGGDAFRDHVIDLVEAGADIIQVRDPDRSPDELLACLEMARSISFQLRSTVAVTADVDLARTFKADMIMLPTDGMDPALVHAKLHAHALVGRSAHDDEALVAAGKDPEVNFALVGPVVVGGGPDAPGLALVRRAAEVLPVADVEGTPWFVTGGVDGSTIDDVVKAGGRRARVRVRSADDVATVREVSEKLRLAWVQDPALKDYAFAVFGTPSPRATLRSSPPPTAW